MLRFGPLDGTYSFMMPRMRGSTIARTITAAVAMLSFGGCRALLPIQYQVEPIPETYDCVRICPDGEKVAVTYLGVSGFVIEYGDHVMMTAPLFTNPSLDSVVPRRFRLSRAPAIVSDRRRIERLLPASADRASMILVGHGHYDHLLDVPYIANHRAMSATIYGSPTVRHTLMGDSALRAHAARVVAIPEDSVGSFKRAGKWYYSADSAFRIMALAGDHAPTARILWWTSTFADDHLTKDLTNLPRAADDWKLGETYSYIIDVLDRDRTSSVFRVYYQDAPNTAPLGFPPPQPLLGGRGFDLAILCVATATNTRPRSPDSLVTVLKPKHIIGSHWESFFRPQTLPLMLNPATDADAFVASLERTLPVHSTWVMPIPRTTLRFAAPTLLKTGVEERLP